VSSKNVYSVSQINTYLMNLIGSEPFLRRVAVTGEVSNCKYTSRGHIYFVLKDEKSQLPCVMFSGRRSGLKFRMKDGDRVVVTGEVSVYYAGGKYQLYADKIDAVGSGILYQRYLELKKKLEQEGLFDPAHKKPIPEHVRYLGIVTSATGAAVQDIRRNALARNPFVQLYLYPALVQGDNAAPSIVEGIRVLDSIGCDCIIVGRGGGSIEDLWAFNEEIVVRAIYECETPIISAAGHETDTTLADFAADLRVATPTEAAVRAVEDIHETFRRFNDCRERLDKAMTQHLNDAEKQYAYMTQTYQYLTPEHQIREKLQRLDDIEARLEAGSPAKRIGDERQRLTNLEDRMKAVIAGSLDQTKRRWNDLHREIPAGMQAIFEAKANRLALLAGKLDGVSPVRKLSQGYSYMVDSGGRNVNSVSQVKTGDRLHVEVTDGSIDAEVVQITPRKRPL
jgi:exodeoxyribonuclease VII large subunit